MISSSSAPEPNRLAMNAIISFSGFNQFWVV
jgi:hypothetical protein